MSYPSFPRFLMQLWWHCIALPSIPAGALLLLWLVAGHPGDNTWLELMGVLGGEILWLLLIIISNMTYTVFQLLSNHDSKRREVSHVRIVNGAVRIIGEEDNE